MLLPSSLAAFRLAFMVRDRVNSIGMVACTPFTDWETSLAEGVTCTSVIKALADTEDTSVANKPSHRLQALLRQC